MSSPSPLFLLIVYSLLVTLAALFGGWITSIWRWNHRSMQAVMSFVGGVMLGIAVLHLLPHSVAATGSADKTAIAALIGLLTIFLLIRVFHVHQHPNSQHECGHDEGHHVGRHWHDMSTSDSEATSEDPQPDTTDSSSASPLSWIGLFAGMAIHTMLDGVALAASIKQESESWGWLGLGTFLAVFLHKPLDSLSITSLMLAGGWSPRWQRIVTIAFALLCPLGACVFYFGVSQLGGPQLQMVGIALGFSAGLFLCIALADILPEIQFHAHDRVLLTFWLLAGTFVAYLIGYLEPAHLHPHSH